jgi:hypothetical protein
MTAIVSFPRQGRKRAPAAKKRQPFSFFANLSNLRILLDRFVFDERRGTFHRISETAAFIMTELKAGRSPGELSETYAKRYGVMRAIAERDVELLLNDLSVVWFSVNGIPGPVMR